MRLIALIVALLTIQTLYAGEKSYEAGKLGDVAINDMTSTIWLPTGHGNFPFPLHMGINYQFQIPENSIVYFASCYSKSKRNYGCE